MKTIRVAVLALFILWSVTAYAQTTGGDGGGDGNGGSTEGRERTGLSGQAIAELTIPNLVEQVLSTSPSITNGRRTVDSAYAGYQLALASARPNISVAVNPYTFNSVRTPGGPAGRQDSFNHTFGATVSARQALPTNGILQASAGADVTLTRGDSESSEFAPELSLTVGQPLFAGDGIIDTSVFEASQLSQRLGYEQAVLSNDLQRNQILRSAVGLFVQVASLKRSEGVLERTVEVLSRQLEDARINQQQGLISGTNVLALQVTLNTQRENLLNIQLAAVEARQALARTIGVPRPPQEWELIDEFRRFDLKKQVADALNGSLDSNVEIRLGQLSVQKAKADAVTNDTVDKPQASITASVAPAYPKDADPASLGEAFSDYFDDGLGVNSVFAFNLEVPLLTREERSYREQIDAVGQEIAVTNLDDTRRVVTNRLQTLAINRGFLEERLELARTDVEYQRQRLDNEEALLDVGATTQLSVDQIALDLASRQNELWQLEADLFLNSLDVLVTVGVDLREVLANGADQ